jgi:hypothetical protein
MPDALLPLGVVYKKRDRPIFTLIHLNSIESLPTVKVYNWRVLK